MHICFIIGSLHFSGAEKVMVALASGFQRSGHRVSVILTEHEPGVDEKLPFEYALARVDGPRALRIVRRVRRLRHLVQTLNPDITISFGHANNLNSSLALYRSRRPHVNSVRTFPLRDERTFFGRFAMARLYSLAAGVVFQTAEQQSPFPKRLLQRSVVIPNPITSVVEQTKKLRSRNVITALGRLSDDDKNFTLLISAFSRIWSNFPDWSIEIYGEGPDRGKYQRQIDSLDMTKYVRLMGSTDTPTSAISDSSIFVMPSLVEGMPNALIEALSVGLACIATDCLGGGAKALIENGENGLLVRSNDVEALASALTVLIRDDDLRERLGQAAVRVRSDLQIEKIIFQWERYLYGLVGGGR